MCNLGLRALRIAGTHIGITSRNFQDELGKVIPAQAVRSVGNDVFPPEQLGCNFCNFPGRTLRVDQGCGEILVLDLSGSPVKVGS